MYFVTFFPSYIPNLQLRSVSEHLPGAHPQGATLDELRENLSEVLKMLLEDHQPKFERDFAAIDDVSKVV